MVCCYFILPEECKPCLFYLRNLLYLIYAGSVKSFSQIRSVFINVWARCGNGIFWPLHQRMRQKSQNLCWGVWNDCARKGYAQLPTARGVFPIDGGSTSRSSCSFKSETKVPRYPASVNSSLIDVQFHIPSYSDAISSTVYLSSRLNTTFVLFLPCLYLYLRFSLLWIQVLNMLYKQ